MPEANTDRPTVVLVHGAWGDGSGWQKVIPLLLKQGVPVRAVQNPTTSLSADVDATRHSLEDVEGPVVLVGHSWGGTVITEAGTDPKVAALVYVAAFAPDAGQSTGDQVGAHPTPSALSHITPDKRGSYRMSEEGWINHVAQDLPEEEARVLSVLQAPLAASTFSDKVSRPAWQDRPSWFVVSTLDQAVSVDLQRACALQMKAHVTELASSHMSILSQPDAVAKVILDAVASLSPATAA
jgi:pimeloyl-ACP methyl ester carboxylesterase